MVEYTPLIRLVGALVLHQDYPRAWCGIENDVDGVNFKLPLGFFVVTPAINAMICKKLDDVNGEAVGEEAEASSRNGEEADAGAGSRPKAAAASEGGSQHGEDGAQVPNSEKETSPGKRTSPRESVLETVSTEHDFLEFAEDGSEQHISSKQQSGQEFSTQLYAPNQHRAALLGMLAGGGDVYSPDETILSTMLVATILENDAIDDRALELFGVLPSTLIQTTCSLSPFETAIAQHLSRHCSSVDPNVHVSKTIECLSSLGMMLLVSSRI